MDGDGNNTKKLKPVKIYDSLKGDRVNILKEQRDKSGVYCLINKINGHAYAGSSINLASSPTSPYIYIGGWDEKLS